MSTDKGYIKLYRDITEHWVWGDPDLLRAWLDIIMMVNHKDKKTLFDGKLVTVKRGSKITSLRQLAFRWGWSKDKTSRFLDMLERDGMITQKRDSKKTLINVVKYGFYQGSGAERETLKRHRTDTDKDTDKDTERNKQIMIKNDKRMNKECKEENASSDDENGTAWDDEGWES